MWSVCVSRLKDNDEKHTHVSVILSRPVDEVGRWVQVAAGFGSTYQCPYTHQSFLHPLLLVVFRFLGITTFFSGLVFSGFALTRSSQAVAIDATKGFNNSISWASYEYFNVGDSEIKELMISEHIISNVTGLWCYGVTGVVIIQPRFGSGPLRGVSGQPHHSFLS